MLGRSYGVGDDIDEADLDAELDCLQDELESSVALTDDSPAYLRPLPNQPTTTPVVANSPMMIQPGQPAPANQVAI